MTCPRCGRENADNWPDGLCQECWERECDAEWWRQMVAIDTAMEDA